MLSNDLLLLIASRTVLMAAPCHYGVEQRLNLISKKSIKGLHLLGLLLIFRAVTRPRTLLLLTRVPLICSRYTKGSAKGVHSLL